MNPMLPILSELVSRGNEVVVYIAKDYKTKVESIGAKFVENVHIPTSDEMIKKSNDSIFGLFSLLNFFLQITRYSFDDMIKLVDNEKPDCIFSDIMFFPSYFLRDYLKKQQNQIKPVILQLSTAFILNEEMLNETNKSLTLFQKIFGPFLLIPMFLQQLMLKFKYGTKILSIKDFFPADKSTVVSVLGELQPKSHLLDAIFLGSCITETVRDKTDKFKFVGMMKEIMDKFDAVNPLKLNDYFLPDDYKPRDLNLIYVSFGTIFNLNPNLLKKIIEAFTILENENEPFYAIMALGQIVYDQLYEEVIAGIYLFICQLKDDY
jgi:hypothetical protein